MSRRRRLLLAAGCVMAGLLIASVAAGVVLVRSDWFREKVRLRLVEEVERASGGRVELGAFHFDWRSLTARAERFTLHGTEVVGEAPFVVLEKVEIGLRIISALKRDVDVASIRVERPAVNIVVDEDGNNNIPKPKLRRTGGGTVLEDLLKLEAGLLDVKDGTFRYGDTSFPVNIHAEGVKVGLAYDRSGPRYEGDLLAKSLDVSVPGVNRFTAAIDAAVTLEKNAIRSRRVNVKVRDSSAEVSGSLEDLRTPRLEVRGKASMTARDIVALFGLPIGSVGRASGEGVFHWSRANSYQVDGSVSGSGLTMGKGRWRINGAALRAAFHAAPSVIEARRLELRSNEGEFSGDVTLRDWHGLAASGEVRRVSLQRLAEMAGEAGIVWQGNISGLVNMRARVDADRISAVSGGARLVIAREEGASHPVDGIVDVELDQQNRKLNFRNSSLASASTRFRADGNLSEKLTFEFDTNDVTDLALVTRLAGIDKPLPFALRNGALSFRGSASGGITAPRVEGHLAATRLEVENRMIDAVAADVKASASMLAVSALSARQNGMELQGSGQIALENWKVEDSGAVAASLSLRNAKIAPLLAASGAAAPIDGIATINATVKGTAGDPRAELRMQVEQPSLWGEKLDALSGSLRIDARGIEVLSSSAALGEARLRLEGAYEHAAGDWKAGKLRFNITTPQIQLSAIRPAKDNLPALKGTLSVRAQGTGRLEKGEFSLTGLTASVASRNLSLLGKQVGSASLEATSNGERMSATASVTISGSKLSGSASMELSGKNALKGEMVLEPVLYSTVQDLLGGAKTAGPAFSGIMEGRISFSGALRELDKLSGTAVISRVEVKPAAVVETIAKQPPLDLTLRNNGPVRLSFQGSAIRIEAAHFVATDTNLTVEGGLSGSAKSPWDLKLKGALNLAILRSFNPELKVSGTSVMDATMRGSLSQPALSGRLEVKNASAFLADLPNGIENANGVLTFDKNRVAIQEIKAQSGGGDIALRGFISIGGRELTYRLQADAKNVRVRYPEGVSTTLDANLRYTGTYSKSLLSGTATLVRSGFNAKTDFGGLFAASAKPVGGPPTTSEFLRGLQIDVNVGTANDFQLVTSYTRNVQTDARLQLRGTAARPSLLGRIVINEGDIDFFGSRYKVNRAEVNFYNPTAIEPVLDADLETKVRAVTVNITLTGTPDRLRTSYRSDPPLASSEIIALLTVGRSPDSVRTAPVSAGGSDSAGGGTSGALLGQVLSTSVSGALQKFFGVSRVKIDPRAIGVDGNPQAQLTLEQQISRDVTLTYATSLQDAQQQVVRVEWNVSKQWSAVAVRDQYGIFGIDFYYKKRLK